MTARKQQPTGDAIKAMAEAEKEIPTSQPAEVEKDVVGEAKPKARLTVTQIADALTVLDGDYHDGLDAFVGSSANGNRLTITVQDAETDLVQTFHATVEEGIREF